MAIKPDEEEAVTGSTEHPAAPASWGLRERQEPPRSAKIRQDPRVDHSDGHGRRSDRAVRNRRRQPLTDASQAQRPQVGPLLSRVAVCRGSFRTRATLGEAGESRDSDRHARGDCDSAQTLRRYGHEREGEQGEHSDVGEDPDDS